MTPEEALMSQLFSLIENSDYENKAELCDFVSAVIKKRQRFCPCKVEKQEKEAST